MEKYFTLMLGSPLFYGIKREELASMLSCLGARKDSYKKGQYIVRRGQLLGDMLFPVEGRIHIQRDDFWGNRSILRELAPGDQFGEAYAGARTEPLLYDLIAVEDCVVLFLDMRKMLTTCSSACSFHTLLVQNLFRSIALQNRRLEQKLSHLSMRSTREKLLSYLSEESGKAHCNPFTISYNRQQLADFLSVDRSAMSAELSKMRKEGLIDFKGNTFTLL